MRQYTLCRRQGTNFVQRYVSSIQQDRILTTRLHRHDLISCLSTSSGRSRRTISSTCNCYPNYTYQDVFPRNDRWPRTRILLSSTKVNQYLYKQNYVKRWSTTTTNHNTATSTAKGIKYLDLRGSGLSILERLCLEECLYMKDITNDWIIVGYHDASDHRFFQETKHNNKKPIYGPTKDTSSADIDNDDFDNVGNPNSSVAIILGIGGKPIELLNIEHVQNDSVLCIKRFTGGGTVVVDSNCIWISIIGRPDGIFFGNDAETNQTNKIEFYPRPIMQWTADKIYIPLFDKLQQLQSETKKQQQDSNPHNNSYDEVKNLQKTMVLDTKSCAVENTGKVIQIQHHYIPKSPDDSSAASTTTISLTEQQERAPTFQLRENDYVMVWDDENSKEDDTNNSDSDTTTTTTTKIRKMGGNAQAIGKSGFIHHTSFLWTYEDYNMENYLTLPSKRPTYRSDRSHRDFLIQLRTIFPNLSKRDFLSILYDTCTDQFTKSNYDSDPDNNHHFQQVTLQETMKIINSITDGLGLQGWYEQSSRNKILTDLEKK